MILELKPEQQEILELAVRSGKSLEEVVDHLFTILREEQEMDEWIAANREAVAAHVEEGLAQAERGETIPDYDVQRILQERRRQRNIA
jgi:predicted transcriptional regulator